MGGRLAVVLVFVAACNSKSEKPANDRGGAVALPSAGSGSSIGGNVGGALPGSGAVVIPPAIAPAAVAAPSAEPATATRIEPSRIEKQPEKPAGSDKPVTKYPRLVLVSATARETWVELSPDVVVAKVDAAYMAGLKRCYRKEVDVDPTLQGTLEVALTMAGDVQDVAVKAPSKNLATCVEDNARGWRFPAVGRSAAGESSAHYVLTWNLVQD